MIHSTSFFKIYSLSLIPINSISDAARLTFENENGTWGIKGYDIKNVPKELYGAMCKLRDYERIIESPQKLLEVDKLYSDKCKELAEEKKKWMNFILTHTD